MSASGSTRAIVAAFLANLGIAVAKLVGFAITGASSMLSEAIHSLADTGNQALLVLGGRRARRDATEEHPFGHSRERYFWSFVVAVVLFTLGAAFSVYEGVHKIRHPEPLERPAVALAILGVAVVLEGLSFRTAAGEARPLKGDRTWWGFLRTSKVPELPVVLLEDSGALLGLCVALAAVLATQTTGDPVWDGVGAVTIGVILGAIALFLCVEMKSLLIGESALTEVRRRIRAAAEDAVEVTCLIHMRTEHLGPDDILVAAKVEFAPTLDMAELASAIDDLEGRVRSAVSEVRLIYVEPDLLRPGRDEPGTTA